MKKVKGKIKIYSILMGHYKLIGSCNQIEMAQKIMIEYLKKIEYQNIENINWEVKSKDFFYYDGTYANTEIFYSIGNPHYCFSIEKTA